MDNKMFALGQVKAVDDDGDPNGSFEVVLSTPTLDRDGEVVDAKVFEPLPDHITFDIDHGMSTATTVGSGVPRYEGEQLVVRGTYSSIPRAQEVRTLVREGHIRTTSVAFMGAEREQKDGVTHIVKAELLNGAFVPIPSNRQAVVLSAKSYAEAIQKAPVTAAGDEAFLKAMIPHHEAAIRMAEKADLTDQRVRDLAAGIIRAQRGEITRMRGWLGDDAPAAGGGAMPMKSPTETPEPATASAETDPEKAAAPAAAKSPADVSAYIAAARAQAEAASVL